MPAENALTPALLQDRQNVLSFGASLSAASPSWHRPNENCTTPTTSRQRPFRAYTVVNESGRDLFVDVHASHAGFDGYLLVFREPALPHLLSWDESSLPIENCAAGNDYFSTIDNGLITGVPIAAGENFVIVVSSYLPFAGEVPWEAVITIVESGCGNGFPDASEACDDGNSEDGDGCSSTCAVESGWHCIHTPLPGGQCGAPRCGDGVLDVGEACDDGNSEDGDGCSYDCGIIEAGWTCPIDGSNCVSVGCGDGIRVGIEQCEQGNRSGQAEDPGCDRHNCKVNAGYACPQDAQLPCYPTTCGDGLREGGEGCDVVPGVGASATNVWIDGCSPDCTLPLSCLPSGTHDKDIRDVVTGTTQSVVLLDLGNPCTAPCGSGILLDSDPSKDCDDGNNEDGDGCSSTCQEERGWACSKQAAQSRDVLELPIIYRDFIGNEGFKDGVGDRYVFSKNGGTVHADFQPFPSGSSTMGIVEEYLDPQTRPRRSGKSCGGLHGQELFSTWFRSDDAINRTVKSSLLLTRDENGAYVYASGEAGFFPLDNLGWTAADLDKEQMYPGRDGVLHNYSFTSELRYWFEYKGGESLTFEGDDDVWVFVNNRLAVDIGGTHSVREGTVLLGTSGGYSYPGKSWNGDTQALFGLEVGKVYEIAVFQAERMVLGSNYKLTLTNFDFHTSACEPICGDGIRLPVEVCDDGEQNGKPGFCSEDCKEILPRQ